MCGQGGLNRTSNTWRVDGCFGWLSDSVSCEPLPKWWMKYGVKLFSMQIVDSDDVVISIRKFKGSLVCESKMPKSVRKRIKKKELGGWRQ